MKHILAQNVEGEYEFHSATDDTRALLGIVGHLFRNAEFQSALTEV